jgi:hypothetical protein
MAYDLAAVLNDGDKFRVVPVVGIGGPQSSKIFWHRAGPHLPVPIDLNDQLFQDFLKWKRARESALTR